MWGQAMLLGQMGVTRMACNPVRGRGVRPPAELRVTIVLPASSGFRRVGLWREEPWVTSFVGRGFHPVAGLAASEPFFKRAVAEVRWQDGLGRRKAVSFGARSG